MGQGSAYRTTIFRNRLSSQGAPLISDSLPSCQSRTKDGDSPVYNFLRKMRQCRRGLVPLDKLKAASYQLGKRVPVYPGKYVPYTEHQVLNGGMPGLKRIPEDTAAGWPFKKMGLKKRDLLEGDILNRSAGPILRSEIDKLRSFSGDVKWLIFLKDELRPAERVKYAETRAINSGPYHLNIELFRIFGPFILHIKRTRAIHGMMYGLNVTSPEWGQLSRDLDTFPFCMGSDVSSMDLRTPAEMMEMFISFWKQVCNPDPEVVKYGTYLLSLGVKKQILLFDQEIEVEGTNPTGWYLTTIMNCYVRMTLELMIFKSLVPEGNFWDLVRFFVYGDDSVGCVSPLVSEVYNPPAIGREAQSMGFKFTMPDKAPKLDWIPKDQLVFLGRTFFYDGQVCLAPLSLETIAQIVYWYKKSKKISKATAIIERLQVASEDMIMYPRDLFDDIHEQLCAFAHEAQVPEPEDRFDDLRGRYYGDLGCYPALAYMSDELMKRWELK